MLLKQGWLNLNWQERQLKSTGQRCLVLVLTDMELGDVIPLSSGLFSEIRCHFRVLQVCYLLLICSNYQSFERWFLGTWKTIIGGFLLIWIG